MDWKRLFSRREKEAEIDEEIQSHIRMAIQYQRSPRRVPSRFQGGITPPRVLTAP